MQTPSSQEVQDPKKWYRAAHPIPDSSKESSSVLYKSTPQMGFGNRVLSIPTGQGMGGGTNINACLVVRPSEDDFIYWPKKWTEEVEEEGIKMSRIMSSVVKVENEMRKNGALGQERYGLNAEHKEECQEWHATENVFQHCEENAAGIDLGLSTVTNAVKVNDKADGKRYRRSNFYEGILEPLLKRNPQFLEVIHFYIGVQAERLLFDNEACTTSSSSQTGKDAVIAKGLECSRVNVDGLFPIMGNTVILSAGAILSPSLLLISGIGDEEELRKVGVTPLCTAGINNKWRGVGKNLRDHVIMANAFLTLNPFPTLDGINSIRGWLALDIGKHRPPKRNEDGGLAKQASSPDIRSRVFLKILDGTSSTIVIPEVAALAFRREYDFEPQYLCSFVNLCFRFMASFLRCLLTFVFNIFPFNWILSKFTKQVLVCLLNPESIGSVTVRRKKASDGRCKHNALSDFDIQVDPAYLSNERDLERIQMSWNVLNRITPIWFQRTLEIMPGAPYKWIFRSNHLKRYISDFALPYYHWSGTCAMKSALSGKDYVVDETLRVRGVTNLYICDASVLGNISGPPALTLAGLGLMAASILHKQLSGKSE